MFWKPKGWILIGVLLAAFAAVGTAQVVTTTVADTIDHADGTPATGTVLISWPAFTTSEGDAMPSGSTSAAIAAGGALSVQLVPNAGATPLGSYYTVVYHLDDGSVSRQYWVVPASAAAVKIGAIESTVLPTSVAMQTVSKSYVDTAIAAAVSGHPLDSSPYVLKSGDTMSGPLALPADPVSAAQAANKNYVDESVAAVTGGLGQKVSTLPLSTQVVAQPAGTQLGVNNLNGVEYASQYVDGRGNDGIANALASPVCAGGCEVKAEPDYTNENYSTASFNGQTHLQDARGGHQVDSYKDPLDVVNHGISTAQSVDDVMTQSEASLYQQTGNSVPGAFGLSITQEGLAGGSNLFPEQIESPPYFKMGYSALSVKGTYNTQGQHGLVPEEIDCFGVGDCLIGSQFLYASGGIRDSADEGAHPFDLQTHEDSRVFVGTCATGCAAGSTSLMITQTSGGGTQGDGRFLIDANPAKTIASAGTGGSLVGGAPGGPHATAQFSGTNFPISVFLSIGQAIPSQAGNMAPGLVTFSIATSGVPSGYATNTGAITPSSGVACVTDQTAGYAPDNYEMAPYTVVDATHLQVTFNKPHQNLATLAFGGLCGYGLEQTVDTANGIRQLFPVVGTYSPTGVYYAGGTTPIVGTMNRTSGFLNINASIASATRSGNVVSVVTSGNLSANVNGLTLTIAGVTDSSYNGDYVVTTTGANSFTYAQAGANSSSSGGTASVLTGGFALYPMAEVLSVFDAAAKSVNGQMTLAPNNVAWAPSDPVEEPHYYQEYVSADTEFVGQSVPRPSVIDRAGIQYQQNNGPGLIGWSIANAAPAGNYLGYGGTHSAPDAAYEATGIWARTMTLTAGEQAAFTIDCNLHGCGNWNSNYNLFELQSSAGADPINYSPSSSTMYLTFRGTPYSFTPQAFTAGTISAGTVNATTLNGALSAANIASGTVAAARLPLFGPSGAAHAAGIVPDPGATAGSTRYLREDGTWTAPSTGAPNFAGAWASGTTYTAGQAVSDTANGNSYVSLIDSNTGNNPSTTPADWGLLASASPGVTTAAMNTAINTAVSNGIALPMSYATMGSTASTLDNAMIAPTAGSGGGSSFIFPTALPANTYVEQIAVAVPSVAASCQDVVFLQLTRNGSMASYTVTNHLCLPFANAVQISPGVYQWSAGSGFSLFSINASNVYWGPYANNLSGQTVSLSTSSGNTVWRADSSGPPVTGGTVYTGGYIAATPAASIVTRAILPSMNFAGAYSGAATYSAGQTVVYSTNGNSYVSLTGNNTGNAPTNAAYWGVLSTSAASTGVETRTLQVVAHKGLSYTAGTPATIFSASGAGNVERIQIAMTDNSGSPITRLSGATSILTITVDGQAYSAPLGMFLLWDGYQTTDGTASTGDLFESKYLSVTAGTATGNNTIAGSRRIYIKYNSSIGIQLTMPAGMSGTVYTQVEYYSGVAPAGRYPATRNVFHMVTNDWATSSIAPNTTLNMLPAISGAGELESIYFVSSAPGPVTPGWLEIAPALTVDGTAFQYGGCEDLFGNQFYGTQFHGRTDEYGIARYVSSGAPDNTTYWTGYRYFRETPMLFNSSLAASWLNANTGNGPATRVGSLIVYYTTN